LGKLKFEFAISDVEGDYEFYSPGYEQEFWDTINNKRNYYAILRDTDNLALTETNELLIIIVPDVESRRFGLRFGGSWLGPLPLCSLLLPRFM
jgi:two-component system phosphate regulon sensor histidine kinase PhoR